MLLCFFTTPLVPMLALLMFKRRSTSTHTAHDESLCWCWYFDFGTSVLVRCLLLWSQFEIDLLTHTMDRRTSSSFVRVRDSTPSNNNTNSRVPLGKNGCLMVSIHHSRRGCPPDCHLKQRLDRLYDAMRFMEPGQYLQSVLHIIVSYRYLYKA